MSYQDDCDDIGLVHAWPKTCHCGKSYDARTWRHLSYVGTISYAEDDLELRNCTCHSTLAVPIEMSCPPTQREGS